MICNATRMTLEEDCCTLNENFQDLTSCPFFPVSHLFCQVATKQVSTEQLIDYSSSQSFMYPCWNILDLISPRRINDRYSDCLYRDDERNCLYPVTEPHRYQRQTVMSPNQYVSFQQLGNGVKECDNGSDEISREVRWSLLKCYDVTSYACWIYQYNQVDKDRI